MKWLPLILLFACGSAPAQFTFPLPLPTPKTDTHYDVPTLYGEVDAASAAKAITAIQAANKVASSEPIKFYLDSPGGLVVQGGAIISAMQASKRPITTIIVGQCASMCAVISEYATRREVAPHGYLMLHNPSVGISGDLPHIAGHLRMMREAWADHEAHIAARIGMDVTAFRAKEAEEWWLTASEAVDAHLADAVINPADYPAPRE